MRDQDVVREKARAIATVILEIDVGSSWGNDCTIGQVYKQAKDTAEGVVEKLTRSYPGIRLIQDIKIDAIIAPNKK